MKKRILACIVCLCVVLSIAPTIVFAEVRTTTKLIDGSFIVESKDGEEFTIDGNDIIINQAGTYYVTGSTYTD